MQEFNGIAKAGDVKIEQIKLITGNNVIIDLTEFLVELNLFEDIFSNYLQGNIVLTDSRNLIGKFNLSGEESLILKFITPSFDEVHAISKTFTTYRISDRRLVRDNNTQMFTIHFVSTEMYIDILLPLFKSFEGNIIDVAESIFQDYITTNREYEISNDSTDIKANNKLSPLIFLNEPANKVKFVAPGWTPFKCINWLASKAIPKDGKAKNFLFYESNKSFYFGSLEAIFADAVQTENSIGTYTIAASNVGAGEESKDVNREMFLAKEVEMIDSTDQIKNHTNGYLASRLVYLDVFNKQYELIDYDYVNEYKNQFHTSGSGPTSIPPFSEDALRNPATCISFYPKNPKLFQTSKDEYFKDNVSEKMGEIHGNRRSSLLDVNNIKMNITVPGRTDIEVGRVLYFLYPELGAKEESDSATVRQDPLYSGYYLITAIRHKLNRNQHFMTMEIVKDSFFINKDITL
jgi:hypothetical protein